MPETTPYDQYREESPTEGRLAALDREAFELAVTSATKAATQEVARVHRVRLVTQSAVATLCVSLVVFAIGGYILYHQAVGNARGLSGYNCRVLTDQAQLLGSGNGYTLLRGKPMGFLSSDAYLRSQETLNAAQIHKLQSGALKSLLVDPQALKLQARNTSLENQVTKFWLKTLIPALSSLARVNCAAR